MTSEAATEEDLDMTNTDNEASEDEQVRVEAWLDEHPEFFQEYLIRKGKDRIYPKIHVTNLGLFRLQTLESSKTWCSQRKVFRIDLK